MIILDSDVLSEVIKANTIALGWLDRQPRISVWTTTITIFEIRSGLASMPPGRRQSAIAAEFENLINEDLEERILPFDGAAAEHAAILAGTRQRAGRPRDARDTMIAGIALAHRATLATRNMRHFDDLNVPVVDPWHT